MSVYFSFQCIVFSFLCFDVFHIIFMSYNMLRVSVRSELMQIDEFKFIAIHTLGVYG